MAAWRERLEHNALWVSLATLALAAVVVAVGVRLAPETFYDRFWWEDIYGPLVVDAHQCRTDVGCPGVVGPPGVRAKDGYTITSELTYGATLAVLLYGIYVGLFRRFGIQANGRFVLGLLPWIMLGPLARALEDADVFCRAGTHCEPNAFAFLFISPVIYIHIALYVMAAMLLGVWLDARRERGARFQTGVVAAVLGAGTVAFAAISLLWGDRFSALPPIWFVALVAAGGAWLYHRQASRGRASMDLVVFVLGLPYALGSLYLIAVWLLGPQHVWSSAAWSGAYYRAAGVFIVCVAILMAFIVAALARTLHEYRLDARWAALASRVKPGTLRRLGYLGGGGLALGLLMAGILPNLAPFFEDVPSRAGLAPLLMLGGLAVLVVFAFVGVGHGIAERPRALLVFTLGINAALVLGHVMDGTATWIALSDPLGFGIPQYSEKHPFSEFLLRYWGGFLFPAAKLTMVLVVVWLLDREVATHAAGRPDEANLVGLVKMAIFVLGFAPGLRDTLRLAMGV